MTKSDEKFVPPTTMDSLMKELATSVAAVDAKQTASDNAKKNYDGAVEDLNKATAVAKDAYAKVAEAVNALVPGIAPAGGRDL